MHRPNGALWFKVQIILSCRVFLDWVWCSRGCFKRSVKSKYLEMFDDFLFFRLLQYFGGLNLYVDADVGGSKRCSYPGGFKEVQMTIHFRPHLFGAKYPSFILDIF